MPDLVSKQLLHIPIDFYGFALQDIDDSAVPVPYPDDVDPELNPAGFLTFHEGRIDVQSAGHTHEIRFVAEVWDSEPGEDHSKEWEAQATGELRSPSGELAFWTVAGSPDETVLLGKATDLWRVRMYSAGRTEVQRLAQRGVPKGIEQYLAQFWPTGR
ncbi:hypothetical protein I5Q34_32520 [Streptomyces sp. AV19]|uniref:hypothetical protein n=1 Tax=Streptomyces sp. AV19 TaxID=2793068 RepID=UPI0018FE5182|nr:hypothetical protein [Streptomyces sp. AV19]MBH1938931.1 hypothetical protein [Streptomyces sp. AV19]MDG4531624.1 hypothetical protein [Streptomyces sp. AV19]